jgi:hypothetical protein
MMPYFESPPVARDAFPRVRATLRLYCFFQKKVSRVRARNCAMELQSPDSVSYH